MAEEPVPCPCGGTRPPPPKDGRCEPLLRRCGTGHRWLAVSPPESPLRIGVIGRNETEARSLYREREATWLALPDAEGGLPCLRSGPTKSDMPEVDSTVSTA